MEIRNIADFLFWTAYARKSFWAFCQLMAPDFYQPNRPHLKELCEELQSFYFSDYEVEIINEPPRHGKSRTLSLFTQWLYGQSPKEKVMTGSYNETLSTTFSKSVRNGIGTQKAEPLKIVYSDIFPDVTIQRGDAAANLWSLVGQYSNYLATSPTGTATGFGCSMLIIDDLIKNSTEAYNENLLQGQWDWFTNTMLTRREKGAKIIIVMTRWSSLDLAGRAIEHFKSSGQKIRTLIKKALQDDGTMLCNDILDRRSYENNVMAMSEEIASANYQQIPIDLKGRLYQKFKTYDIMPEVKKIKAYIDTADTGADYLCSIVYGDSAGEAYVSDVLYTKDGMETTEKSVAEQLFRTDCRECLIEGNNGGEGFARSVRRILNEKYHSNKCVIKTFHQSQNKDARILSNATWIENHMYYPAAWEERFKEYHLAMFKYQKEGKNKHDDAPDATTGVAEQFNKPRTGLTIGGW